MTDVVPVLYRTLLSAQANNTTKAKRRGKADDAAELNNNNNDNNNVTSDEPHENNNNIDEKVQKVQSSSKKRRTEGATNYTNDDLLCLVNLYKSIRPIRGAMWQSVAFKYNQMRHQARDSEALKSKFMKLVNSEHNTANSQMPEVVRLSKIYYHAVKDNYGCSVSQEEPQEQLQGIQQQTNVCSNMSTYDNNSYSRGDQGLVSHLKQPFAIDAHTSKSEALTSTDKLQQILEQNSKNTQAILSSMQMMMQTFITGFNELTSNKITKKNTK
jgi:hypothetical protein